MIEIDTITKTLNKEEGIKTILRTGNKILI